MTRTVTAISASIEAFAVFIPPPKPLTQEGRILAALGLAHGPLPHAVTKWLIRYYEYLSSRMCLPFEARCPEETGILRPWTSTVKVVELLEPSVRSAQDGAGLRCIAFRGGEQIVIPLIDLDVENDHPNVQLIEDYWYWFWNWQFDPQI